VVSAEVIRIAWADGPLRKGERHAALAIGVDLGMTRQVLGCGLDDRAVRRPRLTGHCRHTVDHDADPPLAAACRPAHWTAVAGAGSLARRRVRHYCPRMLLGLTPLRRRQDRDGLLAEQTATWQCRCDPNMSALACAGCCQLRCGQTSRPAALEAQRLERSG